MYGYDPAGRKTAMIDPWGRASQYNYDSNGNLTQSIDRDNRTETFVYDNDNRLLTETWLASDSVTVIDTFSYTYDADANILTAGNNQGTYTLSYDNDERVTSVIEPFGVTLTFSYDQDGNRTAVTDSFGGVENSTYNNANLLTSRSFLKGSVQVAGVSLAYNADNQITQEIYYGGGSPAPVAATINFTLDYDNRVTSLSDVNSGGTSFVTYQMSYDAGGNLYNQIDHGATSNFYYDSAGQLTQAVQSGGSSYTYSYSYDAAGNRNSTGYATTTGNQMTSDGIWNYSYDNEGNEITKTKTGDSVTYGYDNANHLTLAVETQGTLVTSTVFKYDAFGNRLETDAGTTTTRYAYDGWDPAKSGATGNSGFDVWADLNGSSSLTTRYLRGDAVDQVFARMSYSGSTYTPYYYLTDAQGSIRDVIDASTNLKDTVRYDPYGTILSETNASYRGRYGWDSRETDSSTGLIYNRARYYDPKTGRWLSQDPIGLAAGDSNLYRYVMNRPVDATDASGLKPPDVVETVGEQMQRIRGGPTQADRIRRAQELADLRSQLTQQEMDLQRQNAAWIQDALRKATGRGPKVHRVPQTDYYVEVVDGVDNSKAAIYYQETATFTGNDRPDSATGRGWITSRTPIYVGFWGKDVPDERIFQWADDKYATINNGYQRLLNALETAVDVTQTGLSVVGMIPGPIGMWANVANAGIYLARGNIAGAAISLGGALLARGLGSLGLGSFGRGARTNAALVQDVASRAEAWGIREALGSGNIAGIQKHGYAERLLMRYQRMFGDRGLSTEVRYINGRLWRPGDPLNGSIRLDVVEGPLNSPTAVWDYKFGNSTLTAARINQIRRGAGLGPNVPIIEVRP